MFFQASNHLLNDYKLCGRNTLYNYIIGFLGFCLMKSPEWSAKWRCFQNKLKYSAFEEPVCGLGGRHLCYSWNIGVIVLWLFTDAFYCSVKQGSNVYIMHLNSTLKKFFSNFTTTKYKCIWFINIICSSKFTLFKLGWHRI